VAAGFVPRLDAVEIQSELAALVVADRLAPRFECGMRKVAIRETKERCGQTPPLELFKTVRHAEVLLRDNVEDFMRRAPKTPDLAGCWIARRIKSG
jgi:hypothetical protein